MRPPHPQPRDCGSQKENPTVIIKNDFNVIILHTIVCVCTPCAAVCLDWSNKILFIDESMAVHILFFGIIIWNYSWVRYNT